ncbi:MAG TPA: permease prefix domain 1-containing protein, partial [Clostridia bacterium]|nr:permease prefix domain 1-containing protein [Clostridia bacterium]
MKEEFKKYLDRKFFFFFKSKQIEDYKDELLDGMLQRYREFTAAGAEKAEAYKKTIAHFGDITKGVGALTDIRLTAKENIRRALRFVVMSLLYFLAVTTVYLTVSV